MTADVGSVANLLSAVQMANEQSAAICQDRDDLATSLEKLIEICEDRDSQGDLNGLALIDAIDEARIVLARVKERP